MTDNNTIILSYLAGAMDSDGHFTIGKSSYSMRVRKDATNFIYSEKIGLKQVTPEIPKLLHETFGGHIRVEKPQTVNSKSLVAWFAANKIAAQACNMLLPYLKVKTRQVEKLIELRESKNDIYKKVSYWFNLKYPDWENMELITFKQAANIIGYSSTMSISTAIRNGTLLATERNKLWVAEARIPKALAEMYRDNLTSANKPRRPPELIAWRERLYQEVRELNKIGINGTPIYYREGAFKRAD